jgi:hypothetical protein
VVAVRDGHWVLLHGRPGVLAWIGRVAAFLCIAVYAVTDYVAGIGTGVVMQQSGHLAIRKSRDRLALRRRQDVRGADALALALAAVATAVVAVRDGGRRVLPGGLLLAVSSGCFVIAGVHIYWPRRVLTNAGDCPRLRLVGLNSAPSGLVRQLAAAGRASDQGVAERRDRW